MLEDKVITVAEPLLRIGDRGHWFGDDPVSQIPSFYEVAATPIIIANLYSSVPILIVGHPGLHPCSSLRQITGPLTPPCPSLPTEVAEGDLDCECAGGRP